MKRAMAYTVGRLCPAALALKGARGGRERAKTARRKVEPEVFVGLVCDRNIRKPDEDVGLHPAAADALERRPYLGASVSS